MIAWNLLGVGRLQHITWKHNNMSNTKRKTNFLILLFKTEWDIFFVILHCFFLYYMKCKHKSELKFMCMFLCLHSLTCNVLFCNKFILCIFRQKLREKLYTFDYKVFLGYLWLAFSWTFLLVEILLYSKNEISLFPSRNI